MPEPNTKKRPRPALVTVKSPISLPLSLSIGDNVRRPSRGSPLARVRSSHVPASGPLTSYFAKRESDASALAEACHHAAGDPVVLEPANRTDDRVAVGSESERPVDNPLYAGALERREMAKSDFEASRNAIEVGCEQFVREIPWCLALCPRHAGFFVGA